MTTEHDDKAPTGEWKKYVFAAYASSGLSVWFFFCTMWNYQAGMDYWERVNGATFIVVLCCTIAINVKMYSGLISDGRRRQRGSGVTLDGDAS